MAELHLIVVKKSINNRIVDYPPAVAARWKANFALPQKCQTECQTTNYNRPRKKVSK